MKIKFLHITGLLLSALKGYGQVSEDFKKATLSSGGLACGNLSVKVNFLPLIV